MEKYKYLEHKVDVLFESYGFKLEEAIENAAQATFETIADTSKLEEDEKVEIEEDAGTLEELVIFVLGDLVSEADSRELFFKKFKVTSLKQVGEEWQLKGYALGSEMKPELGGILVKAVTHHECSVKKQGNIWTIHVLLDI
ncbi:MAG: archease [Candidatus Micrarchaeota archaeon]